MANKNTRRARKRGLSAHNEVTIGSGEKREIKIVERQPVMKGNIPRRSAHGQAKKYPFISFEDRRKAG